MRTLSFVASALACAGLSCSSAAPAPATSPNDAGALGGDGGAQPGADAASPAASNQCGPAPFVRLGITVTGQTSSTTPATPIPGARFTSPACPDVLSVSDANGKITGQVSKGLTFYGRLDATTYVPTLTPEAVFQADDDTVTVAMVSDLFTSVVLSGYDATKATVFIGAVADGGTGACASFDGITFSIPGHPEWAPVYYSAASIPQPVAGAVTTTSGRASFAGIDVGEPVALVGTKPGCEVTFVHGTNTGRAPREAAYVTFIGAYVHDAAGARDASAE